jgi:hypothetical protein
MKELDFLPQWYRANRQRQQCRYRHYVLFGLAVAMVAGWNFIVGRSLSSLQAETRQVDSTLQQGQKTIQQALEMEVEIERFSQQADILAALTPRTAISAVLGELSQRVSENIILSRVVWMQTPLAEKQTSADKAVRIGAAKSESPSLLPEGPQCTRVVLTGIAAGGAEVARLIDQLETSDYFENVSPGFSRAKKIGSKEVSEFEVTCRVADYEVQK